MPLTSSLSGSSIAMHFVLKSDQMSRRPFGGATCTRARSRFFEWILIHTFVRAVGGVPCETTSLCVPILQLPTFTIQPKVGGPSVAVKIILLCDDACDYYFVHGTVQQLPVCGFNGCAYISYSSHWQPAILCTWSCALTQLCLRRFFGDIWGLQRNSIILPFGPFRLR